MDRWTLPKHLRRYVRPRKVGQTVAEAIASRFRAGDTIVALAADYDLMPMTVQDLLRYEMRRRVRR